MRWTGKCKARAVAKLLLKHKCSVDAACRCAVEAMAAKVVPFWWRNANIAAASYLIKGFLFDSGRGDTLTWQLLCRRCFYCILC